MKYYLDITLLSDSETPLYFIWEKVYQQIHLALVEMKDSEGKMAIGLSFPKYKCCEITHPLGNIVRIISYDKESIERLNIFKWLFKLSDYVLISEIFNVPDKIDSYACFKRIREKGNTEKLARRRAKRKNIAYNEALLWYDNRTTKLKDVPFVRIKSLSSEQVFNLKIQRVNKGEQVNQYFDSYGLSSVTTVPIF